ncbi:hypothetical protein OIE73_03415 [Streptomyces hirsutus]|uniref:Uncharacterized protein n=1 Tax=Streptomyces hirsutus TaxID=35620 RepID=A0ABZ1GHU8_9ACTN|nr:hypothetical protein [Streptomyces hirsutus]WSD04896.1 hypothetical protein OIE73_03415 [Streptomyces hirsutus]
MIEQIFFDAEDDVLRHAVTFYYGGHPYVISHQPTPEEPARREQPAPCCFALPVAQSGSRGPLARFPPMPHHL